MYVLSLGTMDCLQEVTNSPGRSLRSNKSSQARTRTETEHRHICAVAPQLRVSFFFGRRLCRPSVTPRARLQQRAAGLG
jgi:hypothetical protein